MARAIRKLKDGRRKGVSEGRLPLGNQNFVILGIGVLIIILGYLALLEGSVEGFLPLVVAPILLVLGYCVVIPFGILYRKSARVKSATPSGELREGT